LAANLLKILPESIQPKVKKALHEIWMAPTREDAYKAFDVVLATYSRKYPKKMKC